ncbi:MAG: response regulator [Planctomycetota bacterium]
MSKPKRILVAEDNTAMLGVIRYVFQKAGFDVTPAKCGESAWSFLSENDFDLVVSDFQMPGMTGGQLCERMRNDPRHAETPVILLTAKGLELDRSYYYDVLSVSAIMSKPFSPRELTQTVHNCLAAAAV